MRAVVQRVSEASVSVDNQVISGIAQGLVVLLGVEVGDTEQDAAYLAGKIAKLRIFSDAEGKMNLSVKDIGGQVLIISQFTLLGDARGQNRPGFVKAEEPQRANDLYLYCCDQVKARGLEVKQGVFRAHMAVSLINDGPVTILLDSGKAF
ncbi:MAG: D-tyrosyl-tRNA(Tyr) deacylase [Clostridiales bacterium]|nr:D-tyrosyl-tRNA(Tyr) deacylase [Clostridiales bacterium]